MCATGKCTPKLQASHFLSTSYCFKLLPVVLNLQGDKIGSFLTFVMTIFCFFKPGATCIAMLSNELFYWYLFYLLSLMFEFSLTLSSYWWTTYLTLPRPPIVGTTNKKMSDKNNWNRPFHHFLHGLWEILSKLSVNEVVYMYAKAYSYSRYLNLRSIISLSTSIFLHYKSCCVFFIPKKCCYNVQEQTNVKSADSFIKQNDLTEKSSAFLKNSDTLQAQKNCLRG